MISFLAVFIPMLAKRMMKITITAMDITPPVAVVYLTSPLYLKKFLFWNRSILLRNFYSEWIGIYQRKLLKSEVRMQELREEITVATTSKADPD